jgi:streptogrisin C
MMTRQSGPSTATLSDMKTPMKLLLATSLGAVSALSLAIGPAVASVEAADPTFQASGATAVTVDTALLEQAAKDHALSLDRAAEVLAGQANFSLLLTQLGEHVPQYAGGAIAPTETDDAWIAFTAEPSDSVIRSIRSLDYDIVIRYDAPFSEADLLGQLAEVHRWVESQPGVKGATGSADPLTGSLDFTVWAADAADADLLVQEMARRTVTEPTVNLDIAEAPFPTDEATIGGQYLSNGCTSAFTVKNTAGYAGVLSAAHCPNSATGYTFGSEVDSGPTDAQWHRTTGVENKIRIGPSGTTRTVTGHYVPAAGATLCVHGSESGNKCSTVYSNNVCWPFGGCGFIGMNAGVTTGGDSGGPWYTGSYAIGVHKGTAFINFANRSVMTKVGNALSSLGLSLCTVSYCGIV